MIFFIIGFIEFLIGFYLSKLERKSVSKKIVWFIPFIAVAFGYMSLTSTHPAINMLALITPLFIGMKNVAIVFRYSTYSKLNFLQWFVFCLIWVDMDPIPFENFGKKTKQLDFKNHFKNGLLCIAIGLIYLLVLATIYYKKLAPPNIVCLFSFAGFILIFHSGIFNLLTAFYRFIGVDVSSLMNSPLKSASLSEFWGKRWNLAFIQMTKTTLFLPLSKFVRPQFAFIIAFFLSGIFHEIAISLPVNKGFGLPTCYFLLQTILILIEKSFIKKTNNSVGRIWTILCLILPFPLLFHKAFLLEIILPLFETLSELFKNQL